MFDCRSYYLKGSEAINGTLLHISLDTTTRYDALSYTWSPPPLEDHIVIDDSIFPIGSNLSAALTETSMEKPSYIQSLSQALTPH
ncbi:uncharacterized protein BDZ99DRAFT_464158 [Mytilinidion resinicola]|uniref:Heterokaryon incompatibility domain-containing protein n=1 Tax=Mytilinidion resinicola TaxID=574789 RepID=A0A6A6YK18_9PEZI|nr:uncharacterized protein BDZ99DRAFT_464158 [Mytilinidion resinicola]KAF2808267.1 hypothetical protein BDZ99DRAFT_464158 [Mytilinidion resinicola]